MFHNLIYYNILDYMTFTSLTNSHTTPGDIEALWHGSYELIDVSYVAVRLWCISRRDTMLIELSYADDDVGTNPINESYLAVGSNAMSINSLTKKSYVRLSLYPITPNVKLGPVNLLTKFIATATHPSLSYVTDAVTANVNVALDDINIVPNITDVCCSILVYGSSAANTHGDNHIILTDTRGRTIVSGPNQINTTVDANVTYPLLIGGLYSSDTSIAKFAQTDSSGCLYTHIGAGSNDIGIVHLGAGSSAIGSLAAGSANIGTVTLGAGSAAVGTVTLGAGSAAIGSLAAGSANIGTVTLGAGSSAIGSLAAGSANIGTVTLGAGSAAVGTVALGAGSAAIGSLTAGSANIGTVTLGAGSAAVGTVTLGTGSAAVGTVTLGAGSSAIGSLTAGSANIGTVTLGAGGAAVGTVTLGAGSAAIGSLGAGSANIGTVTLGAGSAAIGSLAAGSANIGTVTLGAGSAAIGSLAAGSANIGTVTLGAGSAAIGSLAAGAANIGTVTLGAGSAAVGTVNTKRVGNSLTLHSGSISAGGSTTSFTNTSFVYTTFTIFGTSDTITTVTVQFNTQSSGWVDTTYTQDVTAGGSFTINLSNVAVDQIRLTSSAAAALNAYMCYIS